MLRMVSASKGRKVLFTRSAFQRFVSWSMRAKTMGKSRVGRLLCMLWVLGAICSSKCGSFFHYQPFILCPCESLQGCCGYYVRHTMDCNPIAHWGQLKMENILPCTLLRAVSPIFSKLVWLAWPNWKLEGFGTPFLHGAWICTFFSK